MAAERTCLDPRATLAENVRTLCAYYGLAGEGELLADVVYRLTKECLAPAARPYWRSFSAINGTGVPCQVSVSLGRSVRALRLLTEVGTPGTCMAERIRDSSVRLREIIELLGMHSAAPEVNELFARLLPKDPSGLGQWTGGIWFAVAAMAGRAPRLRLYINQRWGTIADRYRRLSRLLLDLNRPWAVLAWHDAATFLAGSIVPYGAAVDITPTGLGAIKIYYASTGISSRYWTILLNNLHLQSLTRLVEQLLTRWGLDPAHSQAGAVLPSLVLPTHPNQPIGVKVDLSCNHTQVPDTEAIVQLSALATDAGIDPTEALDVLDLVYGEPLSTMSVDAIQYIGVGGGGGEPIHLNVYISPRL